MDLEKRDYYEEKYPEISYLLLKFMLDTYYPERSDEDTIARFVEEVWRGYKRHNQRRS